jgi:hypothetical protein
MYTLGKTGFETQLLCIAVWLESDGDLVCRNARYQWQNYEWDRQLYGRPA